MAICERAIVCRLRFNCLFPKGLVCMVFFLPLECGGGEIPAYEEKRCLFLNLLMVMTSAMILQAVTMPQPWMVVIADTSLDLSPITATSLDMLYICSSTNSNLARRLLILSASIVSFSLKSVRNNFSVEGLRGIAKYLTIFLSPGFFGVVNGAR